MSDIETARTVIPRVGLATPTIRLEAADVEAEILLKLENLSPIGSFKLRGVYGALAHVPETKLAGGIWTVSAGNFGRALAWAARDAGLAATVLIPQEAPAVKEEAILRLGASVERVPLDDLYRILEAGGDRRRRSYYLDPIGQAGEMAGYGTIGLELAEQIGEVDTVLVPWGSGGLACGIASALEAVDPQAQVFSCEPETGAPLAASMRAGRPLEVEFRSSFVDAAGGRRVFPQFWKLAQTLIRGTHVVTLAEAAAAIRLLAANAHVVAEGAGALPVAAALAGGARGRTVCVVSGGNIDTSALRAILGGDHGLSLR